MLNNEAKVRELYENTELTLNSIGQQTGNTDTQIFYWVKNNYSVSHRNLRKSVCYSNSKLGYNNPMLGKSKEKHPNYIGDVSDGKGYLMRVKPDWYTGRKGCRHVFVHHLVICEALGLPQIPAGFVVHHIDGNKTNNNLSNLALLSAGAHTRLHQLERATTIPKGSRG